MMRSIQAILFDHDGTLVDSEIVHFQFWRAVLQRYGVDFQEDDYRLHYAGVSELNTAIDLRLRYRLETPVLDLVAAKRAQATLFHATQHFPLMPSVAETLSSLQQAGIRMAVVSGSARFALESNLRAQNLLSIFELIASGEEVPHNKPAPDVYLHAMHQMGLRADQCLAVEDTASGLASAKSAGLFTCVIPNRYSAHQNFSSADLETRDMAEFFQWFSLHREGPV